MKLHILLISFTLCLSTLASSAIKKPRDPFSQMKEQKVTMQLTIKALSHKGPQRVRELHRQGPKGYKNLIKIAFGKDYGMRHKWRAVVTMAQVGKKESLPELTKAAKSPQWFMRNAALVSMAEIVPQKAKKWARLMLTDSALIVRTEAVRVLRHLKDNKSSNVLWTELYSKQNYRGKKSLWIRRHIVETLAEIGSKNDVKKFVLVLQDTDKSLHEPAISALEKLTNKKLGKTSDTTTVKVDHWKKWWIVNKTNYKSI